MIGTSGNYKETWQDILGELGVLAKVQGEAG